MPIVVGFKEETITKRKKKKIERKKESGFCE